METDVVIPVLL